jgi:hypothetical protein
MQPGSAGQGVLHYSAFSEEDMQQKLEETAMWITMKKECATLQCSHASHTYSGRWPLGETGAIALLAAEDRKRIDSFFAKCSGGLVHKSLVLGLEGLSPFSDFAFGTEPGPLGLKAFVNTLNPIPGAVHVSASMDCIPVTRDGKGFTVRVSHTGRKDHTTVIPGSRIYEEFERRCTQTADTAKILKKMYESMHSPKVQMKSTGLSGHKVWIKCEGETLITLYIVRVAKNKGKRSDKTYKADRIAVVALEAIVFMQAEDSPASQSQECAICLEDMGDERLWKCDTCGNCLHLACVHDWVAEKRSCSCPYCRSDVRGESL